uniref:helix-turn-helix transcriptional regulator n=1 Tax=Algoriphagus sp. TaxID=1872435 RepID=UPI0040475221
MKANKQPLKIILHLTTMKNKPLQQFSLEEITDKYIGKKGSEKRDAFENELRLDLLGEALKQTRINQKLTQAELGKLVGVQKSQISKLENSVKDARFETVLKVFKALNTRITFKLELEETTS